MDNKLLEQIPCVRDFIGQDNELDQFDYLADLALMTPGLPEKDCTEENRIRGCDSGLYFRLERNENGLKLLTQSDSLFVKGLGAMLGEVIACFEERAIAQNEIGLADLLFEKKLIAVERRRGLKELEEKIRSLI